MTYARGSMGFSTTLPYKNQSTPTRWVVPRQIQKIDCRAI